MTHRLIRSLVGLLLIGVSLMPLHAALPQDSAGLIVDAAQELGNISRYSYGTNHGPWAFVPFNLFEAAQAAGITYLRFPGGSWGDQNNLRAQQIDEFIALCRRMNAEPSITVRLNGGTPETAADLVRYTNLEKGYAVRYWSIGNEPNIYSGNNQEQLDPAQAADWNGQWRAIAEAMRAVDPSIILVGPDTSQYPPPGGHSPKEETQRAWLVEFLKANGDLVDMVSVHRYPFPKREMRAATRDDLRQNGPEWDAMITDLRQTIRDTLGRDMPIAVTEFNSTWGKAMGGEATPDSLYNAVWLADVLGRLIRQRVDILAHFTLQSPTSIGSWGLFGPSDTIRPSYYVYLLYKQFGTTLLEASSSTPDVSLYAARRDDGTLTLMVINLSADAKNVLLRLDSFTARGDAEIWRLDAEHHAEQVATEPLAADLALPGSSVTLVVIPG